MLAQIDTIYVTLFTVIL